jgi:hypothetical protein
MPPDKIVRYQTTINRQLYQAINQLERLQRFRKGDKVPAHSTYRYCVTPRQSERPRTPIAKCDPRIARPSWNVRDFLLLVGSDSYKNHGTKFLERLVGRLSVGLHLNRLRVWHADSRLFFFAVTRL